jgi:acyl carrier protein
VPDIGTPGEIDEVNEVVRRVGKVAALDADQDMYDAGVSSVVALELLLELEERFGVSLPDERFMVCRTPRALFQLIAEVRQAAQAVAK